MGAAVPPPSPVQIVSAVVRTKAAVVAAAGPADLPATIVYATPETVATVPVDDPWELRPAVWAARSRFGLASWMVFTADVLVGPSGDAPLADRFDDGDMTVEQAVVAARIVSGEEPSLLLIRFGYGDTGELVVPGPALQLPGLGHPGGPPFEVLLDACE